ncbi:MAG TPA: Glu/Leu/Phe/Val dehydrogenase dimerization domain-containing protein [Acidimicrobiales bacterium]|nr:Glu/Leu/Phe/Val dehydrogenase dimerization domain-containing protein [Acidimicrobiales bacterium]
MQLFDRLGDDYEEVVVCHDAPSGLRAVVAIHSTALGPALGGTRFYPYRSEDDAFEDVLRLAEGMTYKSAAAGLDLGGGKAVIIGDPATTKNETLLRVYGRFIDSLGGRYITAEDVGTSQTDMDLIFRETRNVTGVSRAFGGSGDPSAATAYGLLWAMKAVLETLDGVDELTGRRVVVSGVGKVGTALVRHLVEERADVTVADVDDTAVARVVKDFGVQPVPVNDAHTVDSDIFSPCALGGACNEKTIAGMRCRAIVGSANNQLATPDDALRLADRGILYAPDFVVNAGGVINIAEELVGYHRERAYANICRIADTTKRVLATAQRHCITPTAAAEALAHRRIADVGGAAGRIRSFRSPARRPGRHPD